MRCQAKCADAYRSSSPSGEVVPESVEPCCETFRPPSRGGPSPWRAVWVGTVHVPAPRASSQAVRTGRLRALIGSPAPTERRRQVDVNSSAGLGPSRRVLVVSDWRTDPDDVIRHCRDRAAAGDVAFALVVPAWLHGLDWVGDPLASRPCAARQLESLVRLAVS